MACSPLLREQHRGAGTAIPRAVGVSGQAAVHAGLPIELTAGQGELQQPLCAAHQQLLLLGHIAVVSGTGPWHTWE